MRMPRLPQSPIVTALLHIAKGVDHVVKDLHALKEQLMADFSALNSKLDEHAAALGNAVQRVNDDVQALRDEVARLSLDSEDQAKVDAAVARVQESIDALNAIDPVRADDSDVPDDDEEPVEPAP